MPESACDALQIFLGSLCEDYWHHAGGGTTLNAAQLKTSLSKIDKHLRVALDEIESDIVGSNALQHHLTFPRPETGIEDFCQALVGLRNLQQAAAAETRAIDHKNRGEAVTVPLPYHSTDDFLFRAEITVPGRSDTADAQIWAAYKVWELIEIFTDQCGSYRHCAVVAALLLPFLNCKYGRAYMAYRRQLHDAIVEVGGDPVALAMEDPSGKALLAAVPRGHSALEARPKPKNLDFLPFIFAAETAAVLGRKETIGEYDEADNRNLGAIWFKDEMRRADKHFLDETEIRFENRESVFFKWGANNHSPSAVYAFSFAGQGAYRSPARKILKELIHDPLCLIAKGMLPMHEISLASIEWQSDMDCLKQLDTEPVTPELVARCSLAYLRALGKKIADHVTDKYLAKHKMAIPDINDVWKEWANRPIDAFRTG